MQLRSYKNSDAEYNIGLDAGTGSCGWAVLDDKTADLCRFKGKPTWGSRIYDSASTASGTRSNRCQRRRIQRRKQRICLLQDLFREEIEKVDKEFFERLNNSFRVKGDEHYLGPIFNEKGFSEKDFYNQFKTVYHLRYHLMTTGDKADIRLVYLALHNIVKCRGNFLYEDNPSLKAENADTKLAFVNLRNAINDYFGTLTGETFSFDIDEDKCQKIIMDSSKKRADKREELEKEFSDLKQIDKSYPKLFAGAVLDYSTNFEKIFDIEKTSGSFFLSDDVKASEFEEKLDEGLALFEAMKSVYSAIVLINILNFPSNFQGRKCISKAKIQSYEDYEKDLKMLKKLIKKYNPDAYDDFFRGKIYDDGSGYDVSKANGYTRYNLKRGPDDRESFIKEVKKTLQPAKEAGDLDYQEVDSRIDDDTFLKRQKTGESGAIPFQLHLEEMNAIIENQGKFYPFLIEEKEKLNSLVTFRIPYYVGPLTLKNARKDSSGKNRFAWSERIEGKEDAKVYPWNWDEIIDKDKSAQNFMNRMIGTCTYIYNERVLPKCSIRSEFYCVLNELNGSKWTEGDGEPHRFNASYRQDIIKELFMRSKTVSYKKVQDYLKSKGCLTGDVKVFGGQGESGYVSKLSSWIDFCKILSVEALSDSQIEMAEEIILWKSLYQDKDILKRRIRDAYGDILSGDQIKQILKKPYSGWGNLSETLLLDLKAETDNGKKSIMDILWEGNQNNGTLPIGSSQVFMEIYHDDKYAFEEQVERINEGKLGDLSIETMPGSPALKRTVNQSKRIVEEIVRLAGKPPKNIYIEYTRDDDKNSKGRWTDTRYKNIKEALKAFENEDKKVWEEFKDKGNSDLADDRLALYFMQRGKCMYSGRKLDISSLSSYQIDHIIPQCYIKDDSIDNKVLVFADENQRKLDNLLLDTKVRNKMSEFWKTLKDAKLISDKKYANLTRSNISEKSIKGFIARQLVETNQIVKFMKDLLSQKYPDTKVRFVKASVTSGLRERCDFVKCRDINDFHHAHDAYLACRVGMFINKRHSVAYENPIGMSKKVAEFVKAQGREYSRSRKIPGSGGFFVSSFMKSGFDKETGEIFRDDWDAEKEIARIKKVLDYKQVYISKMPQEKTGPFWDANVLSPHATGKSLEIKRGLDSRKYGSYNNLNPSYGLIFQCEDKRGKSKIKIVSIPIVKNEEFRDASKLNDYLCSICEDSGTKFVKILRNKVLPNQLLEHEGNLFYYVSPQEVKNALQIAFSQNETKLLKGAFDGEVFDEKILDDLLDRVFVFLVDRAPVLFRKLGGDNLQQNIGNYKYEDKVELLKHILEIIKAGKKDRFNSKPYGGTSGEAGRMSGFTLESRADKLVIIDQSVTGMLEKRTKICKL